MAFLSVNGVIAVLYLGAVVARRRPLVTAPRLELRGVGHAYGGRVVLAGVERVLEPGRALGLLGPNGSGKSTLLRCIAGLLRPRAGHVLVDGRESCELAPAERARVAYAGHRPLLWGGLSARENLVLCAGLYGLAAGRRRERARGGRPRGGGGAAGRGALAGPAPAARAGAGAPAGAGAARAGRAAQRARRGEQRRASTRCSRRPRGQRHARARDARAGARRAAVRRADAARGAALSAHAVPFARAVRLLVRTDVVLERRAPQLALAMGLFAAVAQVVLHYGADIAQPAGRPDRRLALGHAAARDAAGRRARLQRRARRGPARRARARADPAHRDLGGQGDRDRRRCSC